MPATAAPENQELAPDAIMPATAAPENQEPAPDAPDATPIDAVLQTAAAYFGFSSLKAGQRDVIEHLLASGDAGGDVVCKFRTGYGKSLCYCVPALHARRIVLVVSPLCSLIQDQTTKLNTRARVAYNLSSSGADAGTVTRDESLVFGGGLAVDACGRLLQGAILFCTPEKLEHDGFRARLRSLNQKHPLAYIVLDEAHLVAEQGYSFRSAYLELGWLRKTFPDTRICCFSATCNHFVTITLQRMLTLRGVRTFELTDLRLNLHLNIHYNTKHTRACTCSVVGCRWGDSGITDRPDIVKAVATFGRGEAIIFAVAKKTVEELAHTLQRMLPGKIVSFYHGGLSDAERVAVQNDFVVGSIDILVATAASFGTGVDMPRVAKVVVVGVPSSIHTLVQLVGRGGRRGQPYWVDLFVFEADVTKQRFILQSEIKKLSKAVSQAGYAQYLTDSFALVQRMLHTATQQSVCCIATLLCVSGARETTLNVPYAQLAALKAVNAKVVSGDRARWNQDRKRWLLPPLAPLEPFTQWCPTLSAPAPCLEFKCMRCSVCKATRKRKTPDGGKQPPGFRV